MGGLAAALGLVLMLLTSLVPVGTYAFPAFAGMLLIFIVIEIGRGWAIAVFAVTAVLAFLLSGDKEAALLYAIFLGYYPILKSVIELIKSRAVQWLVKLAVFNAAMIGAYYIDLFLLGVSDVSFELFHVYLPLAFLAIGNLAFIIYDICVTRLVTIYMIKWHKKFNKNTML